MAEDLAESLIIDYSQLSDETDIINTTVPVNAKNLCIIPSSGDHCTSFANVKVKNLVNHAWKKQSNHKQIMVMHSSCKYIAYLMSNQQDTTDICILNRITLVEGVISCAARVVDMNFCYKKTDDLYLAYVDTAGDVYVYSIQDNGGGLPSSLYLYIQSEATSTPSNFENFRLIWCPYVPEEDEPDEEYFLLAVSTWTAVRVWNVKLVHEDCGSGPISCRVGGANASSFLNATHVLNLETKSVDDEKEWGAITQLGFAPDGTTVALAFADGVIRFYQLQSESNENNCIPSTNIHDWKPCNESISKLFFLDNYMNPSESFWKNVVCATKDNRRVMIASCETWTSHQWIEYAPKPHPYNLPDNIILHLDTSARFLVLADQHRKLLVIFELNDGADKQSPQRVISVSEHLLPSPIFDFCVVQTTHRDNSDGSLAINERATIKLSLLQSHGIQDYQITIYKPDLASKFVANYAPSLTNNIELEANSTMMNGHGDDVQDNEVQCVSEDKEKFNALLRAAISNVDSPNNAISENVSRTESRNSLSGISIQSNQRRNVSNAMKEVVTMSGDDLVRDLPDVTRTPTSSIYINTGPEPNVPVLDNEVIVINSTNAVAPGPQCSALLTQTIQKTNPIIDFVPVQNHRGENARWSDDHLSEGEAFFEPNENVAQDGVEDALRNQLADQQAQIGTLTQELRRQSEMLRDVSERLQSQTDIMHRLTAANYGFLSEQSENKITQAVLQSITATITSELEYSVRNELQCSILPTVEVTMQNLGTQVRNVAMTHLTNTEQITKDHISKSLHKKTFTDMLANSVSSVVGPIVSHSFGDVFSNHIIPKFEESCREMFQQVNTAFAEGTKEFVALLGNHIAILEEKQNRLLQTKMDEFLIKNAEIVERTCLLSIQNSETQLTHALERKMEDLKKSIQHTLANCGIVSADSVSNSTGNQKVIMRNVDQLLKDGKYNQAVGAVLSVSRLDALLDLCKKLNPELVFVKPCPLEQHILLSLIQQLSNDMEQEPLLKMRFIEEAVMCLDSRDPVSRYYGDILPVVKQKVQAYSESLDSDERKRAIKMLITFLDQLIGAAEHAPVEVKPSVRQVN